MVSKSMISLIDLIDSRLLGLVPFDPRPELSLMGGTECIEGYEMYVGRKMMS